MKKEAQSLASCLDHPGRVLLVEASSGMARQRLLDDLLAAPARQGARTWRLDCDFHQAGLWSGVNELFRSQMRDLQAQRPDLVHRHDYELVNLLPEVRRSIEVRNPTLTDTAADEEKVRNYPADRAFRIVQGLIDLLAAWKEELPDEPWVLALDGFDGVSHIGRRFFGELARRRARQMRLTLIVAVSPGKLDFARSQFRPELLGPEIRVELPADPPDVLAPEEAGRAAQVLEEQVSGDRIETDLHLPQLIRLWRLAGHERKVLRWRLWALEVYNTLGFYEDALVYGEGLLAAARQDAPDHEEAHWGIFVKLFMSLVALQRTEEAHQLAADLLSRPMEPGKRGRLCYLMAMLWGRYFQQRDLARGEDFLEEGLRLLREANLPGEELHFQTVFNRNGLAMIRTFQGRFQEALELCRSGYEQLEAHLTQDRHRLHRSVLLYNMARVYTFVGASDQAIEHFTAAIEMDPHYSEYYNERGSVYLKTGQLEAALADYRQAIELSPPYYEVYTNLGHCHRLLGNAGEAVGAYSISLDLSPEQPVALLGRAQAHEAGGDNEQALADYDATLRLRPDQWQARAARAVLLYEAGRLQESLDDLNRAIELFPEEAELYSNRAVVLTDLGCYGEAADDLSTHLRLSPAATDRPEVEQRLRELETSIRLTA